MGLVFSYIKSFFRHADRRDNGRPTCPLTFDDGRIPTRRRASVPDPQLRPFRVAIRTADKARRRELVIGLLERHAEPALSDQWFPLRMKFERMPDEKLNEVVDDILAQIGRYFEEPQK